MRTPWIVPLESVTADLAPEVGGKALALARLGETGERVPRGAAVTASAYREFLRRTGLGARIRMELTRRPLESLRWEELWDASLRIRSLFLRAPWPTGLREDLIRGLEPLGEAPRAVRSSAPGEDGGTSSFAGLHETFLMVRGAEETLEALRKVWASLWSDGALMYRRELGLDPRRSAMGAVVQEMVEGDRSGVAFGQDPTDPSRSVVEAVWGLNQGLVDGSVEPDRWLLDRRTGAVREHRPALREHRVGPAPGGVALVPLDPSHRDAPPLEAGDLGRIHGLAMRAEGRFGAPQDVEWTFRGPDLWVLQSRPITTLAQGKDKRSWYRSLTRSFENLKALRRTLEEEILPGMGRDGAAFRERDPVGLSDRDLGEEILRREEAGRLWTRAYRDACIPFAHGVRLFLQVANDRLRPEDPYLFLGLLQGEPTETGRRNGLFLEAAALVQQGRDPKGPTPEDRRLGDLLETLEASLGAELGLEGPEARRGLESLLARTPLGTREAGKDRETLEAAYRGGFGEAEGDFAAELLDLARASWRLRDDDNLILERVLSGAAAALQEGRRRLGDPLLPPLETATRLGATPRELPEPVDLRFGLASGSPAPGSPEAGTPRQLTGQPAGPGVAQGPARVVRSREDCLDFQPGEVLVCDAVDPSMTFVVPLASAVVERRGGMLIHGAIVAREYGLPCVTGVEGATERLRTGEPLWVDGYLGLVVRQEVR